MIFDLPNPIAHVVKAFLPCTVISQYNPLRSSVIGLSYRPKPLLTSSVPDLYFDFLAVYCVVLDFEINA